MGAEGHLYIHAPRLSSEACPAAMEMKLACPPGILSMWRQPNGLSCTTVCLASSLAASKKHRLQTDAP